MKAKYPGTRTSATSRPLELLHLDLIGLTRIESLGGKRYIIVVVDDFTRYTWVILLRSIQMLLRTLKLCVQDYKMRRT